MKRLQRVLIPLSALVVALSAATAAGGQSLADRAARNDGTVRFSFPAKPNVCGDGAATIYISEKDGKQRVQVRGNSWNYTTSKYTDEWMPMCEEGPVRIALSVDDGVVTSLRTYVGREWRASPAAIDLGRVSGREAADFLLAIAARPGRSQLSRDAIFAATLAEGAEIWPRLIQIARNGELPREARKNAIFWLGQEAAAAATAGLRELVDSRDEIEIREQAVFALSQRPNDESVPALIALIRRPNVDPRIKKTALFWLGQKDDPRALALFEELLIKG
jgi:hypothetical protein